MRGGGEGEWADKPDSVSYGHLSRNSVAAALKLTTRVPVGSTDCTPICHCSRWGLPSHYVAAMLVRSYRTVSAFHQLTVASQRVFFSVALSVESPRPAVNWHPTLRSPDFPHLLQSRLDSEKARPYGPLTTILT